MSTLFQADTTPGTGRFATLMTFHLGAGLVGVLFFYR
jgi:hypothetical protein